MKFLEFVKLIQEGSAIRSYSCLMLDCQDLYSDIAKIHEQIASEDVYDDEPGHGCEHEIHITVKYGIHLTKPSEALSEVSLFPIRYKIKGISLFENENFDVLKFDIQSTDLRKLNKQVCEKLECTDKFPVYSPHMTCAYIKPGIGKKYINLKSHIIGSSFVSNRFIFSNPNSEKVWIDV